MSTNHSKLNEILKISRDLFAENLRTLAVFDLDSTLFNVSTRTQKILSEFAELHQLEPLKNVEVRLEDWGIKEAVLRAGYSLDKDFQLLKELRDFWYERFFSNEYIHYDVPYFGAIDFVNELASTGCEINYLTGRDQQRMGTGSLEVLNKWGFPCKPEHLFLKPDKQQDDGLYKTNWFLSLDKSKYKKIYFFENEPINVNAVEAACPEIEIIFLDTTHARKETVAEKMYRITHYGRNPC